MHKKPVIPTIKKLPKIEDIPFNMKSKGSPPVTHGHVFDYFAGEEVGRPIYNAKGCKLASGHVLARTFRAGMYELAFKYHTGWHVEMTIRPEDPGVKQLEEAGKLKECPRDPKEVERETLETLRREREEQDAKEHAAERARVINARKEKELLKQTISQEQ